MTYFFKPDVRGNITSIQLPVAVVPPAVAPGGGVSRRRRRRRQVVQYPLDREVMELLRDWLELRQNA